MFERLKTLFKRAVQAMSRDDFLAIPSREVVETLEKKGWQFEAKDTGFAGSRYGVIAFTSVMTIKSPEGEPLVVGKNPLLWQRYKVARERALQKLYAPEPGGRK